MKKFIALNVGDDYKANALCLINAENENHAEIIYEGEERENFYQDHQNSPDDVDSMVAQSMEDLQICEISSLTTLNIQTEDIEQSPITNEEIKKLISERGLTLEQLVENVIQVNGMVGVGIISLSDHLKEMTYNKTNKSAWKYLKGGTH